MLLTLLTTSFRILAIPVTAPEIPLIRLLLISFPIVFIFLASPFKLSFVLRTIWVINWPILSQAFSHFLVIVLYWPEKWLSTVFCISPSFKLAVCFILSRFFFTSDAEFPQFVTVVVFTPPEASSAAFFTPARLVSASVFIFPVELLTVFWASTILESTLLFVAWAAEGNSCASFLFSSSNGTPASFKAL